MYLACDGCGARHYTAARIESVRAQSCATCGGKLIPVREEEGLAGDPPAPAVSGSSTPAPR